MEGVESTDSCKRALKISRGAGSKYFLRGKMLVAAWHLAGPLGLHEACNIHQHGAAVKKLVESVRCIGTFIGLF